MTIPIYDPDGRIAYLRQLAAAGNTYVGRLVDLIDRAAGGSGGGGSGSGSGAGAGAGTGSGAAAANRPMTTISPFMPGQDTMLAQQLGAGFGQSPEAMLASMNQYYRPMQVADYSPQPTLPTPTTPPAQGTPPPATTPPATPPATGGLGGLGGFNTGSYLDQWRQASRSPSRR